MVRGSAADFPIGGSLSCASLIPNGGRQDAPQGSEVVLNTPKAAGREGRQSRSSAHYLRITLPGLDDRPGLGQIVRPAPSLPSLV
jgi:hypothetical protein